MSIDSTIKDYLQGKIQGIDLPESALRSICVDAGIEDISSYIDELTDRQKDLALAYAYIALLTVPPHRPAGPRVTATGARAAAAPPIPHGR